MDYNKKVTLNYIGFTQQSASDKFIIMSFAQVLQIPIARPILNREVKSGLYSPTAYYVATTIASLFAFMLYPLFESLLSYWAVGVPDTSLQGFLVWVGI